jgi:ABC-type amino acid transport substrate-binding protein
MVLRAPHLAASRARLIHLVKQGANATHRRGPRASASGNGLATRVQSSAGMYSSLCTGRLFRPTVILCGVMLPSVILPSVILLGATPLAIFPGTPSAGAAESVLDKLRAGAPLQLGSREDARPFSFKDEAGQPAGYSVDLCHRMVDAVKAEPGLSGVSATWVPVAAGDRFSALEKGQIHVFCGADTVTAERKNQVAFSIPIFPGGIGVLVRADAPMRLREVLLGRRDSAGNTAAASATNPPRPEDLQTMLMRAFTAVTRTTSEAWLKSRIKDFGLQAFVLPVDTYDIGVQQLLGNKTDAFFAERAMLLDTVQRHASGRQLAVIDRLYTQESLALSLPRGDDAWRQLADRMLGRIYASGEVGQVYEKWFGPLDDPTREFFRTTKPSE